MGKKDRLAPKKGLTGHKPDHIVSGVWWCYQAEAWAKPIGVKCYFCGETILRKLKSRKQPKRPISRVGGKKTTRDTNRAACVDLKAVSGPWRGIRRVVDPQNPNLDVFARITLGMD